MTISKKAYETVLTRARNAEGEVKELRALRDKAIVQANARVERARWYAQMAGERRGLAQAIDLLGTQAKEFQQAAEKLPLEFMADKFKYASWGAAFTQFKFRLEQIALEKPEEQGRHWSATYVVKDTQENGEQE